MTTNDKEKELTSTEILMNESTQAELVENSKEKRDAINTKLCYERALLQFYEEEGINPEEEKTKKELYEQKQKELDEMTFGQEMKFKMNEFKENWNNPVRKKVMISHGFGVIVSIFRFLILFGLCFIIFLPIFEKISFALRSPMDITNPQVIWIPENWSFINITMSYNLLTLQGSSFLNTILLSVICMVIQIFATAIPGYAFARLKFKGSNIIFYIVIASLAIPNEALQLSRSLFYYYYPFFGYSLLGKAFSMGVMTIFGMGVRSAIFIFLFRQAFRNLPKELEESAEIDGAGVIRTFISVMFPNVRSTMISVALFAFVWQYNDYYFAQLFQFQSKFSLLSTSLAGFAERITTVFQTTFPLLYQELESVVMGGEFSELIIQTSALLMMLPLLIMYLFVQRQFVESVERSGITGM